MNFTTFPVGSTNIFPQSNSKTGNQLLSEWNIRSREMVETPSIIQYEVGPSFVHGPEDFRVTKLEGSSTAIHIAPGRGVVNGHFIQTLTPMVIDLVEANVVAKQQMQQLLKGELAVGIKVFYSTEENIAGTMKVADENDDFYLGVQIVVLPKNQMVTPIESPDDVNKVTAHLRLATFTYVNSTINEKSITNLDAEKCQYISAERISDVNSLVSGDYIKKTGLNPKKIYTFALKGSNGDTSHDTWCDSTDSLMVWDKHPIIGSTVNDDDRPSEEASFVSDIINSKVHLVVPHKQVDGMFDGNGKPEWYMDKRLTIPSADYSLGTPGVVTKSYTDNIRSIKDKIDSFYQMSNGKQVAYMDIKDDTDDNKLPEINSNWDVGDYVLVSQDYTISNESSSSGRQPSTLYSIIPGYVESIDLAYVTETDPSNAKDVPLNVSSDYEIDYPFVELPKGLEIDRVHYHEDSNDVPELDKEYPTFFDSNNLKRGQRNLDYFTAVLEKSDGKYLTFYYVVVTEGTRAYSNAVLLTRNISLATEETVGGFLNVPKETQGLGYVHMDENGHLLLNDYSLLSSGVLAYQLGQDWTIGEGLTSEAIQEELDDKVNQRVAFHNVNNGTDADVVKINLILPKEDDKDEPVSIDVYDIDSRFGTCVWIHLSGEADSNTTLNIVNCEKVRITKDDSCNPVINVYRSCIYYDTNMFNYIRECNRGTLPTYIKDSNVEFHGFEDITLWHEKLQDIDPMLCVDGMTISEFNPTVVANGIDYWSTDALNDNHFKCALKSITFSRYGEITGCEMLVANDSTNNIEAGHNIISSEFELPQGNGLTYPLACMTKQLKITGTFVSAYKDDVWYITDTNFTALTSRYDSMSQEPYVKGSISFHVNTTLIETNIGKSVITEWEAGKYHIFRGGAIR